MAEVAYTVTRPQNGGGVLVFTVSGMTASDTSDVIDLVGLCGVIGSVQITDATGGTVTAQVSNDGTNWETLKDVTGGDIDVAAGATGIHDFSTAALKLRLLGGSGLTSGDAVIVVRESME